MPESRTRVMMLVAAAAAVLSLQLLAADEIGLPNCPTSCGNISVPYPFGFSPRCHLPGFNLTCDASSTPPRLLLGDGSLEVARIDVNAGDLHVRSAAVNISGLVAAGKSPASGTWGGLGRGSPFHVAPGKNELILTGCDVLARLSAGGGDRTINGCASFCHARDVVANRSEGPFPEHAGDGKKCVGVRCCQATIPVPASSYAVVVERIDGAAAAPVPDAVLPVSVLIAKEGWFDRGVGSLGMFHRQLASASVPLLLHWVINSSALAANETRAGSATCPKDLGISACHGQNSFCKAVTRRSTNTTDGYICHCQHGYQGNPYLPHPQGCQDIDECAIPGLSSGVGIGIGVGSGAMLLFLVLGTTFLIRKVKARRKKKIKQMFLIQNRGQLLQQLVCQRADIAERMIITLEELEKATNNFDRARKLGRGGHGTVYKGILSSLHVVAIKKSKIVIQREIDDFINEIAILSQINHKNIVKILGYRLRIAVEIATATVYLHSFASLPIIHRDIKSPNILLDDNLTVKLSDFGASRCIPIDQTGLDTTVQGTYGYLDPMYHNTGHLTEKSDLYSFGVLLIELLTRKKPVSYRSPRGHSIVKHFVDLVSEAKLDDILDPQITREGGGEVIDVALLAAMCVKYVDQDRPTMRQVEMTLASIHAAKEYVSSDVTDDLEFEDNNISGEMHLSEG
ncbi:hypothetical protein ACP70R_037708 [Stipagrostis hirtigluma subsp. patula]